MYLDFFNVIDKERQYKEYLSFHIGHVEEAFHRLIEPLKGKYGKEVDDAINTCGLYIPLHDLSKLSKHEFDAYRLHFYPTDYEKENNIEKPGEFDKAWEHHHTINAHHPIHWVTETGEKLDMPLSYIFEMLCDWDSVSQWYDSSIIDWYDNNAQDEKDCFTENTGKIVDFWFDKIFREPGLKF